MARVWKIAWFRIVQICIEKSAFAMNEIEKEIFDACITSNTM